jgi:8-amino-7-oxononanoate synthase
MDQKLKDKLNKRKEEGTLRSLSSFSGMIDFQSNDYLGLSEVAIGFTGSYGGTGSRLISGTSLEALEAERFLAEYFNAPSALFFNSGYDANIGFFGSVPQKGDFVVYDEEIHASVRDGIRLSYAKTYSFRHNDPEDLKRILAKIEGTVYVAIESLYSMSGEVTPLEQILQICEQFNAHLIVDEAHAGGVYGDGKGYCAELGLQDRIFARLITFGKAFGSHGAVYLVDNDLKDYLVNFARSFIYTTALPPSAYKRIVQLAQRDDLDSRRKRLQDNINLLRESLQELELFSDPRSPIQSIRFQDIDTLRKVTQNCLEAGFAVKAIYAPTVPLGKECLRINLRSDHDDGSIHRLSSLIMKGTQFVVS